MNDLKNPEASEVSESTIPKAENNPAQSNRQAVIVIILFVALFVFFIGYEVYLGTQK